MQYCARLGGGIVLFNILKKSLFVFVFIVFWLQTNESKAQVSAMESALDADAVGYEGYSPWNFSAFSLSSVGIDQIQDGGSSVGIYNYLSANYRLGGGKRISFRLPFMINTAGYERFNSTDSNPKSSEFQLQDQIISYVDNNLVLLPGDIEVFWEFRTYLPTGQSSRDQKTIVSFRNDFIISKSFSRYWDLEYFPKFQYYFQSNTTFIDQTGKLNNTKLADLNHWVTLWYKYSPSLSLGWQFGGENEWYNSSEVDPNGKKQRYGNLGRHSIKSGPSVRFAVSPAASFIVTLQNKVSYAGYGDNTGSFSDFGKFNADQTEIAMMAFLGF